VKLRWLEPVALPVAAGALRALASTWRIRRHHPKHLDTVRAGGRPFVFALWHSRLLPLLYAHRDEGVVALISRHRDGGHLASLATAWGYGTVRGSSGRGGDIGLRGVVRALRDGRTVAFTPDGPRGPAEQVKGGVIAAAQLAGVPILPIAARASRAWWFASWDRFCLPQPFATVDVVYGPPLRIAPGKDALAEGVAALERALHDVTYGPDAS
jgi:hypothetical protein